MPIESFMVAIDLSWNYRFGWVLLTDSVS